VRSMRYAVRWPSEPVHWQVQWPMPTGRVALTWPE